MMNGIEAKTGPEVKTLQGILPERDFDADEDWRGPAEWRGDFFDFSIFWIFSFLRAERCSKWLGRRVEGCLAGVF